MTATGTLAQDLREIEQFFNSIFLQNSCLGPGQGLLGFSLINESLFSQELVYVLALER